MRKRHWLTCLLSVWLTVVGGQAFAQPPALPNDVGNPDLTGMLPAPYNANYGAYAPPSYGGMPAGYPPGATAWPNISPYTGPPVDQTLNQNGLWFNRIITGNRKYFFTPEILFGNTHRPNDFIGDPQANVIPANVSPGTQFVYANQQFEENPAGFSLFTPDRATDFANGGGGGGGGGNGGNGGVGGGGTGDLPVFVGQSTANLQDRLTSMGFRGTWGWWNPDQSGFQASGFFLSPSTSVLNVGDPRGFDAYQFNNAIDFGQELLTHLHALAGLPLGGADTDQNGLPGMVMPFDIYYRLQFQSQVGGFNADWYTSPLFEKSAFSIRPMFGARYMRVRETFQLDGADSGLGYTIGLPSDASGGNVGGGGGGGGGGNAGTTLGTGWLSPTVLEATASTLNIMQSQVFSSVSSDLAGPEAGLRFDIGKQKLKIWAQSKFGLLVNHSSRNLSGYNIGDAYYSKVGATITDPTTMPRNNPSATRFQHEDSTTALSPMFEQGVFAKANLFQFVPVLNKSKILNGAEFQAGYTVIVVGNVYRPSGDITWNAFPGNPILSDKRSTFVTSLYSLGLQWDY